MSIYSARLRLYSSTGEKRFTIDQSGETSGDITILDTERATFSFNKPCNAPEFTNASGASLSLLDGFVGQTVDVRDHVSETIAAQRGSDVVLVSSSGAHPTIQSAVSACPDGGTVLVLAGTYNEAVVLDPLKGVTIMGDHSSAVVLQPTLGLVLDGISLVGPSTKDYFFRNLTVSGCRWGMKFPIPTAGRVEVSDVLFEGCGWDSTEPATEDAAGYSALWASGSTSDGGALYLAGCTSVSLARISVRSCARGLFVQDVSNGGSLTDCSVCSTLGTAIELASSSGTASAGCTGIDVSNCRLKCVREHGIKIVGGAKTKVYGCSIDEVFCSGILLENTQEVDMTGTILARSNLRTHSGFGVAATATGTLSVHGAEGVSGVPYVLNASGCTFSCGGPGSQAVPFAVYAESISATVNVSGCGYICFDPLNRTNDLSLVTDAQLSWISSQLHGL